MLEKYYARKIPTLSGSPRDISTPVPQLKQRRVLHMHEAVTGMTATIRQRRSRQPAVVAPVRHRARAAKRSSIRGALNLTASSGSPPRPDSPPQPAARLGENLPKASPMLATPPDRARATLQGTRRATPRASALSLVLGVGGSVGDSVGVGVIVLELGLAITLA